MGAIIIDSVVTTRPWHIMLKIWAIMLCFMLEESHHYASESQSLCSHYTHVNYRWPCHVICLAYVAKQTAGWAKINVCTEWQAQQSSLQDYVEGEVMLGFIILLTFTLILLSDYDQTFYYYAQLCSSQKGKVLCSNLYRYNESRLSYYMTL